MNPTNTIQQLIQLAQNSHKKGDLAMAISTYKEILRMAPAHVDVLHWLGLALCSQKAYNKGIPYLEKAVSLQNDNPILLTNMAFAYFSNNQAALAIPLLLKSLAFAPQNDDAWFKLGLAYKSLFNIEKAIESYEKAIAINPNHTKSIYNLGNLMLDVGRYKSAIQYFEQCLAIHPAHAMCHNNIAIALLEWDRFEEAEKHYKQALSIDPNSKETLKNIVQLYEKIGKEEEAKGYAQQLLAQEGAQFAKIYIENKAPIIAQSNYAIDEYRHSIFENIEKWKPQIAQSSLEFLHDNAIYPSSELIYQGRDNKAVKEKFAYLLSHLPKAVINKEKNSSKPKIGFVVTRGHEGVFLKCMKGLLQQMDKQKFSITVVCSLPNGPEIIKAAIANPEIEILALPNAITASIALLSSSNFDVLYYWEIGTDAANYYLAWSKPAKVQVTSWGWPITSGLNTVDYFVSNKNLETTHSIHDYSEKVELFEKLPVFYYHPPVPKSKTEAPSLLAIAHPDHRYICQQNLRKVHPDFDALVKQILIRDSQGFVFFIHDKHTSISNKLYQRMLATIGNERMNRVIFLERMPETEYLNTLTHCTLALDTLHYGGGANTVYDAMEVGLPIITLAGNRHSARFATATYMQMGVVDAIAQTIEEYVEKVIYFSQNKSERLALSEKIRKNNPSIFEDIEAVKEWESFFEKVCS